MYFDVMKKKKKHGGTKQQMNALLKFEILAVWYEFGSSVSG